MYLHRAMIAMTFAVALAGCGSQGPQGEPGPAGTPGAKGAATNFAAGTVTSPGLYVTGDSDTGLYQSGANTLSVTAGGVEVERWNTVASAVSYFSLSPSATGNAITLAAAGSDTNVGITVSPKGAGAVTLNNSTTIAAGTASAQHYADLE